jgi:hypothetical protein
VSEKAIQKQILKAIGSRPDVRLWRQNTGVGRALGSDNVMAFGLPGCADLSGIVAGGRRLEIEVKSQDGRQTPQQKRFEQMITRFGGIYILARSVEDAVAQLETALQRQPEGAWRTERARRGSQAAGT